jgi:hypothetical protein
LSTPNKKTQLLLSMEIPCWSELVQYGAGEVIQREYGNYITETEQDYAISLLIDLETVPPLGGKLLACATASHPPQLARTKPRYRVHADPLSLRPQRSAMS